MTYLPTLSLRILAALIILAPAAQFLRVLS